MFQEPKHYIETHGLDTPPYERFTVCPHCGGAFVEAHRCDCCGEFITADYVVVQDGKRYCEECYSTLVVPWALVGQQGDASQAFGSGLTYANRYFMLKFFQIATPDDDPDNWRSKKEEAEQEAEMAIVRPIITKIDDHVKAYLNANENEASARKALIEVVKKYVKDGNKPTADYMNYLTDPTVAGELLEELQKQFPIGAKKKSVAKKEGNA